MDICTKNTVEDYLNESDWRTLENSNVNYSIGGLILHNSGKISANYWLNEVYNERIKNAHFNGDFHIHDLGMIAGYCTGWSLRQLLDEGISGVEKRISCAPAKHLSTAVMQIVNFLGIMQNEWAGAQAFSSVDTFLAPYVKIDNLNYIEVKQAIQSLVFGLNVPNRWGSQPPFTNFTFDINVPHDLKDKKVMIAKKEQKFTYGDCQKEMNMLNKIFIEIMLEGDADGRGFSYPIPTYNITKDFDWGSEVAENLFELTSKYGTAYFQNFINSDLNPDDVRSMCCRLQLDKRELRKRGGGLFGADDFTGSIGVVTLNLPRIGFETSDKTDFFEKLDKLLVIAKESLEIKRAKVQSLFDRGLFPYTKQYLHSFRNHFSTVGIVGMHECCMNFLGEGIDSAKGKEFSKKVLLYMRSRLSDFQEETGNLYNLEATPAESTSYRLAKIDKNKFEKIYTSGENDPYYTNSTHLPVDKTENIFEALDHQDDLQTLYTGGTVLHGFIGEKIDDWKICQSLVQKIFTNYKLPYLTLSPTYSVCKDHGRFAGEIQNCEICNKPNEIYTRIVGYYRAVSNWNKGKKEEYRNRVEYSVKQREEFCSVMDSTHAHL